MTTVEFCFDFVSPMSYFAFHRLQGVQERTGCTIDYRPIWLYEIMKANGNRPPGEVPAKRNFYFVDTLRHAKRFGLPWTFNPDFPLNTLTHLRMCAGLLDTPDSERFIRACFHHMWGEPKNIEKADVTRALLTSEGFDANALFELAELDASKEIVKQNTASAIERGAFGAPTFFVEGELYFGQDRLDFVEDALTSRQWV